MDELTGVGAVFALALVVLLFGSHCGDDAGDADELGRDSVEPVQLEQTEAEPIDCRPVRMPDCSSWNDRACFHVPHDCAAPPPLDTNRE